MQLFEKNLQIHLK